MEILDIVNEKDEVVGSTSREDIYNKLLCHRIVHVLIFNDNNEMALQLRSSSVSFCPNHWSTTVGGHVQSGESYEKAALREYQEELGLVTTLEFLSKDYYKNTKDAPDKFLTTFKTNYSGPFCPNEKEVARVDFFTVDQIKKMISLGKKFHPELLFLLDKYYL